MNKKIAIVENGIHMTFFDCRRNCQINKLFRYGQV